MTRIHGRQPHRMPRHSGNARDRRYWRRHKREQHSVNHGAYGDATLGDQGSSSDTMHNDTHDAWHRVLDAIGALLVYLHLARQRDNDAR